MRQLAPRAGVPAFVDYSVGVGEYCRVKYGLTTLESDFGECFECNDIDLTNEYPHEVLKKR